ncbi:TetR family transcriptional regulator [Marinobacteraceae bacterium S3BR75-40.1]
MVTKTWTGKPGQELQKSIHYQGRKAARAKSEQRRIQILEAALRIAAKDGIRGVKHRSVAKEAGVPLASTTYYFKDIEELISDAFMLFAENAQTNLDAFYLTLNQYLDRFDLDALQAEEKVRREFAEGLVQLGTHYLMDQLTNRKEAILAEQVFLLEAIRDPELKALARKYREAWISGLEAFLVRLGTPTPETDSSLLTTAVLGLGYDGILYEEDFSRSRLEGVLRRLLYQVMRLPVE